VNGKTVGAVRAGSLLFCKQPGIYKTRVEIDRRPYMAGKKRWTYSGIKAYFPKLSFEEWLGICRRGDHLNKDRHVVVSGVAHRRNW
jgi:hypothetical protein